jgi:prepilin-type processing-associated H-X9-DG protein
LAKGQDWSAYYRGLYADGTSGWTAAAAGIDDLAQFCRENGIKLLIVNYPELRDLKAYRFDDVSRLLGEIAARNRVPYLDLIDSVRGVPEEKLWVTRPDPHPNGYANQLFADAIFVSVKAVLAAGDPQ